MGGLSSGPGPGICFLTLCLLLLAQQSYSAPVQEDNLPQQSRAQGYYDGSSSELSSGCYYNFQHYGEGDRIITNEPCLNCTCRNRMLMCYLRVCPFTKAIGQNCTIEKKPGQCCPLIVCPEVPVQLLTSSTTTEHSESMSHQTHLSYGHYSTAVGHLDDYGCRINGRFYANGAQIPGNIDKPCEVCYCIRNRTACIMQECTLQVEGCLPVYEEGLCCPIRYQCDYEYNYNAITTEEPRPTPGLVLTTTSGPFECQHDGKWYADGSSVDTEDPCEHCYCMKGDIVCAVQECKPPFEKDGHNCTAMPPAPGKCCPDSYHCDGNEIVAASGTTFRQDRMHKFGRNNANVTMSITSSTSSTDKHHGWHYGTSENENDTPNRFTDEQNKDGTTEEVEHMMVTEGIPPTAGPLESGSHHLEGHYEGKPVSEGHGVNTDNMLTISQMIQNIIRNQTQLINQNRVNESSVGSGKPVKQQGGVTYDDKIHFPVDQTEDGKRPAFQMHTEEDGNPLESHSTSSELPEDYYGFTGGSSDIYAEHSGRPQTRPTKPSGVATGTGKPQQGQAIFGEHGHFGRPVKRPGSTVTNGIYGQHEETDNYQGTTDLPESWTSQPGGRPVTHEISGMDETSVMTDEMGNPVEGVTGLPEGFTGKPGSGTVFVYYDEHGKPHKRPVSHAKPGMTGSNQGITSSYEGMTGLPEGFTDRPGSTGTYVSYDKHGRPYKRPVAQSQSGTGITDDEMSTRLPEGFTGKPDEQAGFFGEHGRPKKPATQQQPLLGGDSLSTGIYDESTGYPDGFAERPGVNAKPGMTGSGIMTDEDGATGIPDAHTGRPGGFEKYPHQPGVHMPSGMQGGMTEVYEGTTEISEGSTGYSGPGGLYGEHGHDRPQKKPGVTATEQNKDGTLMVGGMKTPGHYDTTEIFGEQGHAGRPHKKPIHSTPGPEGVKVTTDENGKVIEVTTEVPDGHTGKPESEGAQIYVDEHSQPKPSIHTKPGLVMTSQPENPVEGMTSSPEYEIGRPSNGVQILYDKYGRPIHKKPGTDISGMPGSFGDTADKYEGTTEAEVDYSEKPNYVLIYDHHDRPIKKPVHKVPGMHAEYTPTDKDGNPIEGTTESIEGYTGKPNSINYIIFYDQFGRPHKKPVSQTTSGVDHMNGKPLEEQGTTELPEGYTGTPGDKGYVIVYDKHGRPYKRPIHGKPGVDVEDYSTNKYGQPVEGMTETPEGHTGRPESDGEEPVYDQFGRPIKRPVSHKKPGMDDGFKPTDKYGQPAEGMTETPEGHTSRPESDGEEPVYDSYGRPINKPIYTRPGTASTTTDKYGQSEDETPESQTGKPGMDEMPEIFGEHGHTGRPHKKPVQTTLGTHGVKVSTDEYGNTIDGATEIPVGQTGKPESDGSVTDHGEHGQPKPGVHGKPEEQDFSIGTGGHVKPFGDHEIKTESPVGHTAEPESDSFIVFFDHYGRPHRRPIQKKPANVLTDDEGNPLDGITGLVSGVTDKPEIPGVFNEHWHTGRPFKHPGVAGENDQTMEYEGTTETPDEFTGRPGIHDKPEIFGEHGHSERPYKRPVIHKKPGTLDISKPSNEVTNDHQTGHPDVSYDENGRPHKRPVHPKKPGTLDGDVMTDENENPVDGFTNQPEDQFGSTTRPEGEEIHYGKPDHTQKRPTMEKLPGVTDEEESPVLPQSTTEYSGLTHPLFDSDGQPMKKPDSQIGSQDTNAAEQESSTGDIQGTTKTPYEQTSHTIFGEHSHAGRPQHKPLTEKYPDAQEVLTTQEPIFAQGAQETPDNDIYYDQDGRPIKPLVQSLPGAVITGEDGNPLEEYEGTTEMTESQSNTPDYIIVFDKYGRPIKKPFRKKPGMVEEHVPTTEKYGKPEGVTEIPEGHTDILESDGAETIYDESGQPLKPGIFDEDGKPIDELSGTTEAPGSESLGDKGYVIVYDKHGRPYKRPIHGKPGVDVEDSSTNKYGQPVEGMTETPEGHTGRPESDGEEPVYDQFGRPIKRPVSHKKPGMDDGFKPTDKYEQPAEGMTETPESQTGTPDYIIMYDNHGRPIKMPVHKTPGMHMEYTPTDKDGKPVEGTTESVEGHTGKPDNEDYVLFYDQFGRPHKVPVGLKKPGSNEETGMPLYEHTPEPGTQFMKPVYDGQEQPLKPYDGHKTPGIPSEDGSTDELTGTTEISEGQMGISLTTDYNIAFDKHGRPIKKPIHKKPVTEDDYTATDKYGNSVSGMTETPESQTGRPENDGEEPVYDQFGRPIKRPVSHKKPGMDDGFKPTNKYGQPAEGMTETPEGHTSRPESDGEEPVYDSYGRPINKPIYTRPGTASTTTDKYGQSEDETPESQTGKPGMDEMPEIFGEHGHTGRPHKKPVQTTLGPHGVKVSTDEYGNTIDGATEIPEGQTGKPESDGSVTDHGEQVQPKPGVVKEPGQDDTDMNTTNPNEKPFGEHEHITESPEDHEGVPLTTDLPIVYDKLGRPINKPIRKKPGMIEEHVPTTEKYGKPEGVTEIPEGHTDILESDGAETIYDESGQPLKPGIFDEDGKPIDELSGTTEAPGSESLGDKGYVIVYDKHGRPYKRPIHGKPGVDVEDSSTNKYGQPVEGMTETPEGHTGRPENDGEEPVYDQFGRPIKRPVSHKKPGMDDGFKPTDKYEQPVEGMTETPEGHTSRPESDGEEPVYDSYGRPINKPIYTRPGTASTTTDKYGQSEDETPESQTGKPGMDEMPEIFGEHGHTGRPHKKPVQTTLGTHEVKVSTDEYGNTIDGATEIPEGQTGKPESDGSVTAHGEHSAPQENPDKAGTQPINGGQSDGLLNKPVIAHDEDGDKGEDQVLETTDEEQPHEIQEVVTVFPEHPSNKPESDSHKIMPDGEIDLEPHKRPTTETDILTSSTSRPQETLGVTKKPDTIAFHTTTSAEGMESPTDHPGNDDEPLTFGEHGHTSRPQTQPVQHETIGSDVINETPEGDPTPRPNIVLDKDGVPSVQEVSGAAQDGHPEEGTTIDEDHKQQSERPEDTAEHTAVSHDLSTVIPQEGHEAPIKSDEEHEETVNKKPEMEHDHTTEFLAESSTRKPDPSAIDIHFDNEAQPHQRPAPTHPTSLDESDVHNKLPEEFTGKPGMEDISGSFGPSDHAGGSASKPIEDETHTTEVLEEFTVRPDGVVEHYDNQGRPLKKPAIVHDDVTEGQETDSGTPTGMTEPQLFGEHGRPHKKPILKPETGVSVGSDYSKQPVGEDHAGVTEESSTGRPEHVSFGSSFDETGRPTQKPIDEDRGPEENEISEAEKGTEAPEDDRVTGKPQGTKVAEPAQGTSHGHEESHPESESTTEHPEGIWQYLPPKKPITHDEPEGTMDGKPELKPAVPTTDGLTVPDEGDDGEDDSLIITTDEPEEETEDVNVHSTGHEGEQPTDTKTKIPGENTIQDEVHPTTPGLGSHFFDFTTPGYGSHDSSLPVTDGAIHGHPVTQGADRQPDLTHLGPDGVIFPGANVVFDKDGKPHFLPGQHSQSTPGISLIETPVTTPGYEDKTSPGTGGVHEDGSQATEKPGGETGTSDYNPEKESTPGISTELGQDGVPQSLPDHETVPDMNVRPETSQPEEGKPMSTSEDTGTTDKMPASGHFPGIPADFLPSFSETGTLNTEAPIMIDGGMSEGSPFDAILDSLANVLRPMQTTQKTTDKTESHEVPGEGDCFVDGKTYPHNSDVPPLSPCHTKCTCVSSIIHCLSLKCPLPPEDVSQCKTVHDEKSCCPTYICGETSTFLLEGQELSTVSSEEEHGLAETEIPVKSDGEDSDLISNKIVTDQSPVEPEKSSATTSSDKDHGATSDDHEPDSQTTDKPHSETDHTKPGEDDAQTDDHTPTEKPESGSMMPGPPGIQMPAEEDVVVPTKVTEGQTPEKPDASSATKPGRPQRPQSGYIPPAFDEHHPSTALPSYFGTGKPITHVDEHPDHQRPDSDDHVLGTEEPMTEDKAPHQEDTEKHKPSQPVKTHDDHRPSEEMGEPDSPVKITDQDATTPDGLLHTKKPIGDADHKPSITEEYTPTEEEEPVTKKPDQTIISDDLASPDETHSMRPEESSTTKKKPQDDQIFTVTEETDYHTTRGPGGTAGPFEDHEQSQEKPSVHPTSMDTSTDTTPQKEPIGEGEPGIAAVEHSTSQSPHFDGEEEQTDKKPDHDVVSSEMIETSDVTSQRPSSHDADGTPSGENKDQRPPMHTGQLEEDHTSVPVDQFGKPVTIGQHDESGAEYDSTDKTHPSTEHSTDLSTSDHDEHHKPQGVISEDDLLSTKSPDDKFITSLPTTSLEGLVDSHKQPEADKPEESEPTHTIEEKPGEGVLPVEGEPTLSTEVPGVHKPDFTHGSATESESEVTTVAPHVKPVVEEDLQKPQTDEDSAPTTGRPQGEAFDGQEPHIKPEPDSHSGSMDKDMNDLTTTRPYLKPMEDAEEQQHKEPVEFKPEDDLEHPITKRPDEPEQEVSQFPEHRPDVASQPSTEGIVVDGTPEHDLASTIRPQQGQQTPGDVSHKPLPEEIPEDVLLHPTRTPGTYETQRPDVEADHETIDHKPDMPSSVDETMSTFFPVGFFDSTTKRPGVGADKPEDSTIYRPLTDRPEGTPEGTEKPFNDLLSELPSLADIFATLKPIPFEKPDSNDSKPDEGLGEHDTSKETTPYEGYQSQYTTLAPDLKPGPWKRPIYSTNGTHFIQYVPVREDEVPHVPEGAILGEPEEGSDGEKYWPIIFVKPSTSTAESTTETQSPVPQQLFNGTHFVQFVPFKDGGKPEVPEGATLGHPMKRPDGQFYWPIIDVKPIPTGAEDEPVTQGSFPGQIYNGTHFIQYLPYDEVKPVIPEGATLGQPETAPNGEKYWPIVSTNPIPDEEGTTTETVESQPEQIHNGTHFIQYVPFKDGEAPDLPEGATLGQPQKGPDGQIYWPIINTKPIPVKPSEKETTTQVPPVKVFNGTNFIQYVPFKDGEPPEVPEGATLGQPQKTPDGEIFWPIIYARPQPVKPTGSLPSQVFNGTHNIHYIPYEEDKKPEVPEGAVLGLPQKTPDGQMFWPLIYSKPVTTKPEDPTVTTEEPFELQHFNGTHFIQYIPFTEGFQPQLPEEATLGTPLTRPDGQKYWPIIYEKLPTTTEPEVQPHLGQIYNGTHFIKYVPYRLNYKPQVPEEAILGDPVKGLDGQTYWPIISKKPLPDMEEVSVKPQVFNGTHYIQYIPYKEIPEPEIPEGATLGEPLIGTDGQKYWPIISKKPLPGLPVTAQPGPEEDVVSTTEPVTEQYFNGTHYIQYVPYKPGQQPVVHDDTATVEKPIKGPNDQMYWPIVHSTRVPGLPVTTQHLFHDDLPTTETAVPIKEQVYNGTHYIQYVPYKPGKRPIIYEGDVLGPPIRRPDNQLYWPIIRLKPAPGLPITTQQGPAEEELPTTEPITEQYFNGTHYIQYVPYKPGQRPVIPEEATLGHPVVGPNNQMHWPIIYLTPVPDLPITTQSKPFQEATATTEPVTEQFFNGTHYIQYVPYKPGQRPVIPEEATLGHPVVGPNNQMHWPIIYLTPVPDLPITTQSKPFQEATATTEPVTEQFFNGTHYIQYVPYKQGQRPVVPEEAILGNPTKGTNDQMYWPIIYLTPVPGLPITTQAGLFQDVVSTTEPVTEQVFNGTHYIQYVPYKPGQRPVIPGDATLGKPTKGSNDQMYWPIIYSTPVPGLPVTNEGSIYGEIPLIDPAKGQVYNGSHYIQYVPYKPGKRPHVPEGAKLGKPTKGANDEMYWPIIHLKPVPGIPIVTEKPFEEKTPEKGQYFNGTHYIQYEPYIPGRRPVVPEGAILGRPITKPDGAMFWPIIHKRPAPGVPINWMPYEYSTPRPEQIFNGTHYIQYLPYNPSQMPEVPEGAILGHPQKGPGGQMYWVLISDKPIPVQSFNGTHVVQYVTPVTPGQDTLKPLQALNGTHYVQHIPYTPGQRPIVPEGAVLGKPTKGPEGEMFWPIIYQKRPTSEMSSSTAMPDGQIFNGTHFIRYVPYDPSRRPSVPEGATISNPQRGPDGQKYWVISSKKPLPVMNDEIYQTHPGQIYNGTHYIQYVPYNPSQMPQVPEGAVLGQPQKGPEGQMNWVIISDKPLPAQPGTQYVQYVTPVTPEENKFSQGLIHNGTHYIQYVPYKPAQIPHIPNDATLADLEQGPGGQMFWPIVFKQPPREPIFNGTHYITFAPQNATNIESTTKDHPFWDYGQYGGMKVKPTSTTEAYSPWSKPGQNTTKPTQEQKKPGYNEYVPGYNKPDKRPGVDDSYETIDEDHLIEYPSGSDYDETQEQPYGPGTCRYAGKVYVSAQQIPRDDPCDFCFCFRSDIICLQQSCPPPIPGCHEEPIQGFCCPRYECHVRMATLLNVTSTTTTTTTILPPHFLSHAYNGAAGRTGCFVQGKAYRVGQPILSASGPCMDCICGGDGKMKCEPKVCTPEPMVRQMMGSTEKGVTANHR